MKLTKEKVCVFIENEAQLEQARELLVKYGEMIGNDFSIDFNSGSEIKILYFHHKMDMWHTYYGGCIPSETLITLTELEKILSDGKED